MHKKISNKKQNNLPTKKGSILVYCVIILAMMLVIASGMSFVTTSEKKDATTTEASAQAIQTADSGMQLGIKIINNNLASSLTTAFGSCDASSGTATVTGTIGTGSTQSSYQLTFKNSSGVVNNCNEIGQNITNIQSTGTYKNTVRSTSVKMISPCSASTTCGQQCTFGGLTYGTVLVGSQCWFDRNLGATSTNNDSTGYGWYYQWGRGTDGHQIMGSGTNSALISNCSTAENLSSPFDGGNFISPIVPPSPPANKLDWCSPQNSTTLWQCNESSGNCNGATDLNDPCPSGFHVPIQAEWQTIISSSNIASLKLLPAGLRTYTGSPSFVGPGGSPEEKYWTSTTSSSNACYLEYDGTLGCTMYRSYALPVRCIKN